MAILTYHSLDDSGSVLSTPPRVFAEQMKILHEMNVRVIPLRTIRKEIGRVIPSQPLVVITFDDGFKNVYEHGFPILRCYNFPATIFLVTDYCDGRNDWPKQPPHIKRFPLLTWNEIREMSQAAFDFGSHTRTHPYLTILPSYRVEEELLESKRRIEVAIRRPADMLAYPYGVYDEAVRKIAQTHFNLSCSTSLGYVSPQSDLFALERLDMYYLRRPIMFRHLFFKEMDIYLRFRRMMQRFRNRMTGWRKG